MGGPDVCREGLSNSVAAGKVFKIAQGGFLAGLATRNGLSGESPSDRLTSFVPRRAGL
jgi:hypothetical protein